jgi:hypothetical protein
VRSRIAEEPWGVGLGDLVEQTEWWVGSEEELREKPIRPAGSAASRASPHAERVGGTTHRSAETATALSTGPAISRRKVPFGRIHSRLADPIDESGGLRKGSSLSRLHQEVSFIPRLRSSSLAVRFSSGVRIPVSRRCARVSARPQRHSKNVRSDRQSSSRPKRISPSPHSSHSRTMRPEHSTKRSDSANDRMYPPIFFIPW